MIPFLSKEDAERFDLAYAELIKLLEKLKEEEEEKD